MANRQQFVCLTGVKTEHYGIYTIVSCFVTIFILMDRIEQLTCRCILRNRDLNAVLMYFQAIGFHCVGE